MTTEQKPLELIIFEKEPGRYGREPLYNSPDGFWAYPASHVDGNAANKHLTDAELAAEYWYAMWGLIPFMRNDKPNTRGKTERQQTLRKFATRPHASENGYQ